MNGIAASRVCVPASLFVTEFEEVPRQVVFGYFPPKYGSACPSAFGLLFVPLAFGAVVAHKLGALRHPAPRRTLA